MAHYALLDNNNIVTQVIVGKNEDEGVYNWEAYYGSILNATCKRTSYNTHGGVHSNGGTPYRKNYAGIGYTYDAERDAFVPPKPYNSWILNEDTCLYEPPVPHPDKNSMMYVWDEEILNWKEIVVDQPEE